jgi:hypothetical protein
MKRGWKSEPVSISGREGAGDMTVGFKVQITTCVIQFLELPHYAAVPQVFGGRRLYPEN